MMHFRRYVLMFCVLPWLTTPGQDNACLVVERNGTNVSSKHPLHVHLTFLLNNTCDNENNEILAIKVSACNYVPRPIPLCNIFFKHDTCSAAGSCACDFNSSTFFVSANVVNQGGDQWCLRASLGNVIDYKRKLNVSTEVEDDAVKESKATMRVPIAVVFTQEGVTTDPKDDTTTEGRTKGTSTLANTSPSGTPEFQHVLFGVIGCILLMVCGLSIFVGHIYKRQGGTSNRPLPPAPHNLRHARGNAVMFHAAQNGRESFVSIMRHDYAEIPDDSDSDTTGNSLTSLHTSSVTGSCMSDSSMSDDCLHHIACPSSDSSLPEDYLHPVDSDVEALPITVTKRPASDTSSSSEAVMYSGTPIVCGTPTACKDKPGDPYQNV